MRHSTPVPWEFFLVRLPSQSHGRMSSQTRIDTSHSLDTPIVISIVVNALVILTTVHSQDFCDVVGDRLRGRQTLPIVWPEASRIILVFMVLAWSFGLLWVTSINQFYATAFFGLGALVSMRFYFKRDADSDRLSYDYYNVGMLFFPSYFMSLTVSTNALLPGLVDSRTGDPYTCDYAAAILD
jgi:4-hydroxybenzoate polyprenyltransferase